MSVHRFSRLGVGVGVAGAAAAATLGVGVAHADTGDDVINGWTVTPTGGSDNGSLLPPATLSDPSDSLGLGTSPITGGFDSAPATPLSDIGSNESFLTPLSTIGTADNLQIQDNWFPGLEWVGVQTGQDNALLAFLVPVDGGQQVVDLANFGANDVPPLFNPDASGPIDVGGVQLASPQDGALFNDLANAVFTGNAADFGKATTLFDDLLGVDPSGAASAAAADPAAAIVAATSTDPLGLVDSAAAVNPSSAAADTPDEVLGQAGQDLTQTAQVLDSAPTASLGAQELSVLDSIQQAVAIQQSTLPVVESSQADLPTADQAGLADVDQQLLQADHGLLDAAQGFTSADQAGDLTNMSTIQLDLASLGALGDTLNVLDADLGAEFFNLIGVPDIFLP